MAQQIGNGYILVTERTWGRMVAGELDQLAFELEKSLREARSEQPSLDDIQALQLRNRKISRLRNALMMLQGYRQRRR